MRETPFSLDLMRSPKEIAWLLRWLRETQRQLPRRQWQHGVFGRSWDREDCLRSLKQDSLEDASTIWQAICEHELTGKWPKISGKAAYFLRERIAEAIVLCESWFRQNEVSDIPQPEQPSDSEGLVKAAVITHWDEQGAAIWLEDHKDDFFEDHAWDELFKQDPAYGIHDDYP